MMVVTSLCSTCGVGGTRIPHSQVVEISKRWVGGAAPAPDDAKLDHAAVAVDGSEPIAQVDPSFVCATLDWWPPEKCSYGHCSWLNASLLNLETEQEGAREFPSAASHAEVSLDPEGEKMRTLARMPLYNGAKISVLRTALAMLNLQSIYGWSNTNVTELFRALKHVDRLLNKQILPEGNHMSPTRPDAKKLLTNLEMDYDKIHACPNDCILFRNEYANLLLCPKCGAKRYREDTQGTEVPAKNTKSKDGVIHVSADSLAWNHIEKRWPAFKEEPRCLRFGLAMDGVNPFGLRSSSWSTWHVCLVNYNLPLWLAIKKGHLILSLIIPGKYKAKNMDVYLAPLIEELQLLWTGINVVDMSQSVERRHAHVQGILMWTMHDWPGYGECSGTCYDIQAICDF
ncbi:hypothetical protein L7F22_020378 [Adiantum nelumboides]|nr:hypothetical protein [Adiantum nelumboides]